MKPCVLMFNIKGEKKREIEGICSSIKVDFLDVPQAEFSQTLGALLGFKEKTKEVCFSPFKEEMLIMAGFERNCMDELLSEMRAKNCVVSLKAVATQVNIGWKCNDLQKELQAEHNAMMRRVNNNENP